MPLTFVANPAPQTSPIPGAAAGTGLDYRLVITDAAGVRYGELTEFDLSRITWELNTFGTAEFTVDTTDATSSLIRCPDREVEVWRGTNLLWAGVIVRVSAGSQTMNVQCQGLGWYFKKRHVGKADRTNFLANPEFEDSAIGTFPVMWSASGVTSTVQNTYRILGGQAVELYQANPEVDTHIHQQVYFNTDANGLFLTLVGHFFIRNLNWVGPAIEDRGLFIEVRDNLNVVRSYEYVPIDGQPEMREKWLRGEVGIHLPPNVTGWSVDVRCYAVGGRIIWDALSLTAMESVGTLQIGEDQSILAARLVQHSQSTALGKSDLRIGTSGPTTGVKVVRVFQYADHLPIIDALNERVGVKDGYEWDIVVTPTTRTATTYFPRKTNERPDVVFGLGPAYGDYFATGIVEFAVEVDGEATANEVVVLGEGEGPDREEGGATDAAFLGGLTLERVVFAPAGAPIAMLDALAGGALERLKRAVTVVAITVLSPALIGSLNTGDVVRVIIDHGWVQINGRYRIVRIELNPKDETMVLALNDAAIYEA